MGDVACMYPNFSDQYHFNRSSVSMVKINLEVIFYQLFIPLNNHDQDIQIVTGGKCKTFCIHQSLVTPLAFMLPYGFSKSHGSDKFAGGTHDNDAIANCSTEKSERLYLRHIEIATAIISSETIMFSLPMIYVGSLTGR